MTRFASSDPAASDSSRGAAALCVGGAALALYAATGAPGVLWGDSATFLVRVFRGDLNNPLGLALAHPLYIVLARAWAARLPGDFAYNVNLFSAFCAAATLSLAYGLVARLTGRHFAALAAVLSLGVAHTFWMHAVIAEVYALYGLGLMAELCLLERFLATGRRGWLHAALLVNGLGVSNHLLALLHLPGYAVVLAGLATRRRLPWAHVGIVAVFWIAGASLYLAMIAGHVAAGEPLPAVLKEALTGRAYARNMSGAGFSLRGDSFKTLAAFVMNFPTPAVLLVLAGVPVLLKARTPMLPVAAAGEGTSRFWLGVFIVAAFLVDFCFGFIYTVPDKYVFFFTCYCLIPIAVGCGAAVWAHSPRRRAACLCCVLLPALVYEAAPSVLERFGLGLGGVRDLPGRSKYAYFFRPRKNSDRGAAAAARAALEYVGPGGLLLADSTVKATLIYMREVEGVGPGVVLAADGDPEPAAPATPATPPNVRRFAEAGRAFAFDTTPGYLPDWLRREYDFVPRGPVYQLSPR